MNTFTTRTDRKRYIRKMLLLYGGVLLLIAGAATVLLYNRPKVLLYTTVVMLVPMGILVVAQLRTGNNVTLVFTGAELHIINNKNDRSYVVFDVPASDFVIKQSKKDKEKDTCTLKIKKTIFCIYYAENCEAMRAYIRDNFPEKISVEMI